MGFSLDFDPYELAENSDSKGSKKINLAVIYQFCNSNNLQDQMTLPVRLKEYDVLKWAAQVVTGLKHAHGKGYMIGRLRCKSVWLTSANMDEREGKMPMHASICDFRGARKRRIRAGNEGGETEKELEEEDVRHIPKDNYVSPELSAFFTSNDTSQQLIAEKIDVWCFGCFLFELVTKKVLEDEEAPLWEAGDAALSKVPSRFGDIVKHILRRCLKAEPNKRATTEEVRIYKGEVEVTPHSKLCR